MAEAVGLTSSVITLTAAAYKSCQTIYNIVDGLRGAHEQVLTLSSDLKSFQNVLETLQLALEDEAAPAAAAAIERLMSSALSSALRDSVDIFHKIDVVIGSYQTPRRTARPGFWRKTKWAFVEKKITTLMHGLMQCKMTLNLAICMANAYNTRMIQSAMGVRDATAVNFEKDMRKYFNDVQRMLPTIVQQQEETLALGLPTPSRHSDKDRIKIRTDLNFGIRRFMDIATVSTVSVHKPQTPSFRISNFEAASSTQASSYYTAPLLTFDRPDSTGPHDSLQLALKNMWRIFPYWHEIDGKVGNAEDPGDGLIYSDRFVTKANIALHSLYNDSALANHRPPSNILRVGRICLILAHMRQPGLLQDFLESDCEDQDLPFSKERLAEVFKPKHMEHASLFATEQYRAVLRRWGEGEHLEIDDEEPLPLLLVDSIDLYRHVFRVHDLISNEHYFRTDHIVPSNENPHTVQQHLEEEARTLHTLKHRHIVEVVKTYQRGKVFGTLLHAAGTRDLQTILQPPKRSTGLEKPSPKFSNEKADREGPRQLSVSLTDVQAADLLTAFGCLSRGLAHMHYWGIIHNNVMPVNILYKKRRTDGKAASFLWAGFDYASNLSRNVIRTSTDPYSKNTHSRAPPENLSEVHGTAHGTAGDVFSLGCVFLEILAHLVEDKFPLEQRSLKYPLRVRSPRFRKWLSYRIAVLQARPVRQPDEWAQYSPIFLLASSMISLNPDDRPTIDAVVKMLVDAQGAATTPTYFCQECWEELTTQRDLPLDSSSGTH